MDKKLLKQLRELKKGNVKEITLDEKLIIKEYLDGKEYSLEEWEYLKIEIETKRNEKATVILPVIISVFASFLFSSLCKYGKWIYDVLVNQVNVPEIVQQIQTALVKMEMATEEQKRTIIWGIVIIAVALFLLLLSFALGGFAICIVVNLIMKLLSSGINFKKDVYEFYYTEYIDDKIRQLKNSTTSNVEEDNSKQHDVLETAFYDVKVQGDMGDRDYKIHVRSHT